MQRDLPGWSLHTQTDTGSAISRMQPRMHGCQSLQTPCCKPQDSNSLSIAVKSTSSPNCGR